MSPFSGHLPQKGGILCTGNEMCAWALEERSDDGQGVWGVRPTVPWGCRGLKQAGPPGPAAAFRFCEQRELNEECPVVI